MSWGGTLLAALLLACAPPPPEPDPLRYRLTASGSHWDVAGQDHVLDDLLPRYPEFFEVLLNPARSDEPDLLALREDLERTPVDRRNYDALNAIAIAYYEMNYRGEVSRLDADVGFLSAGFRAAKIVAVPWRAYGEVDDPQLREAILDFFADVAAGEKLSSRRTRGRITRIVASLEAKEPDAGRRERIHTILLALETAEREAAVEQAP